MLRPLEVRGLLSLPAVPPGCEPNYHIFFVILNSLSERSRLIEHLKANGILAVFHYVPLHTSQMGQSMGYREGMLPVTERLSERLLRLPVYYEMGEEEVTFVSNAILEFFKLPPS